MFRAADGSAKELQAPTTCWLRVQDLGLGVTVTNTMLPWGLGFRAWGFLVFWLCASPDATIGPRVTATDARFH